MGTGENSVAKPSAGKGSLDGLAKRLGALEESLTVVADELGVSAVPTFKRLDPDSVYQEAVRRAQETVEPIKIALRRFEARLEEIILAQAQIKREAASARETHASADALSTLAGHVQVLASRLDAADIPIDQIESSLRALSDTIAGLSLRIDTLWDRLDAQARAERDRNALQPTDTLTQRLAGLEHRLERLNNVISANSQPASMTETMLAEERYSALQRQISADVDRRLAQLAGPHAAAPQIDPSAIADEVRRQIHALVKESAGPAEPLPLMGSAQADRSGTMSPLVIGATERAIVRLTRRLEKLEEWRRGKRSGDKPGLMGRLFES